MRLWKLYVCLFFWVASGLLQAQQLRVVVLDIPSAPLDYANLENPENPFAVIKSLGTNDTMTLPRPRAVTEFCASNFELIYPIVGEINDCKLDLIEVYSIESVIYANKAFRNVEVLGLRNGIELDLKKIRQWLPLFKKQRVLNSDEQMLKMLIGGRLDAVVLEKNSAEKIAKTLAVDLKMFKQLHQSTVPVYIGVNASRQDLSARLREILL